MQAIPTQNFGRILRQDLQLRRLGPILTAAVVSGLVVITYQISFGSLIFSGDLAPYLSSGIGFCLMGAVVVSLIEALLSPSPGLVAIPTVSAAVIVAAIAAQVAAAVGGSSEALFPTVTAMITGATWLTGGIFLLLGSFRLGNLVRFIPYPVVGGFLAGTGWLVLTGSLKTMSGLKFSLANLQAYVQPDFIWKWLPGALFGVALLLLNRRFKHYLITPALILLAILAFYLILALTGTTRAEAIQAGLLFKPFPSGILWTPPPLGDLALVDWRAILIQAGEIATLILICTISLLLYASGVEMSTGKEINLNQELRACGVGNLAAGFSASPPGFTIVTMSVLSSKLGANSRLVGVFISIICMSVILFGGPLIASFPKPVLGGVLFFLASTFLVDWLWDGRKRLGRVDYLIVVVLLFVMSTLGLLAGLGIGIAIASAVFLWQYSRVPVLRSAISGGSYHSKVERPEMDMQILRREGQSLMVFELQGYIFFGTANRIYEELRQRLSQPQSEALKVIVLDFRRVIGIDASAGNSFVRLKRLARSREILLIFSSLSSAVENLLRREVLTPADQEVAWRTFEDLDHSLEWFEERTLHSHEDELVTLSFKPLSFQPGAVQTMMNVGGLALLFGALGDELGRHEPDTDRHLLELIKILEKVELAAGEALIQQGETSHSLYFLDEGELVVEYQTAEGHKIRLAEFGPGTVVGELSLLLDRPVTATVIARQASVVYRLSRGKMRQLEEDNPAAAAALQRFLLKRLGERLVRTLEMVEALSD